MSIKTSLKDGINSILDRGGYRLSAANNVHDEQSFVTRLKKAGYVPRTVVDVGVAFGTPYLYDAFSESKFYLIDPTHESLPYMREWAKRLDAEVYNIALAAENGNLDIVLRDTIQHATILRDVTQPDILRKYSVEARRFDSLGIEVNEPALCKIDVEGFEMDVLSGMGNELNKFDVFVVETSLRTLYDKGANLLDVMAFFDAREYKPFDIAGVTRRPVDQTVHQIDFCFARNDTSFATAQWT